MLKVGTYAPEPRYGLAGQLGAGTIQSPRNAG